MIGIYKITNKVNGKVYIGQSISIEHRWVAHKSTAFRKTSKEYDKPLYASIRKYGLDNFDFSVIEECQPAELNEKEIYWIKYYQSNDLSKGYNLTPGGNQAVTLIPEELYKKWEEGSTVGELVELFKVNKSTISKWLSNLDSYNNIESHRRSTLRQLNNSDGLQPIYQYDLEGNFIKEWLSYHQIERELGFDRNCISHCCRGEYFSSNGYRWAYKNKPLISKEEFYKCSLQKGQKKGNSTITVSSEDIEYIKFQLAKGVTQQKIADELGIDRHVVTKINTGKHWNDGGIYPIYSRKEKKTNRPELLEK